MINLEKTQRDQVHEELKYVLTMLREKKQIVGTVVSKNCESKTLPYKIQTWTDHRILRKVRK
jgi:hypothetical protein